MRQSEFGPNRKYYFLTPAGEEALSTITEEWKQISDPVNELLKGR